MFPCAAATEDGRPPAGAWQDAAARDGREEEDGMGRGDGTGCFQEKALLESMANPACFSSLNKPICQSVDDAWKGT